MNFNTLSIVLISFLAAPIHTAPTPDHREVTLAVDSVSTSSMIPPYNINLRFVGATPSDFYDLTVKTDWDIFKMS